MVHRPSKTLLVRLYVKQGQTSTEIARSLGAHPGSVRKWLKQYEIATRRAEDYWTARLAPYPLKARLILLYIEERRTLPEMARHFKLSVSEIRKLLELFGISRKEDERAVLPPPPSVERVVANQWNTDPEFAPYCRKVVERKELPYAKNMDGTFEYVSMDTLECGHTKPTKRATTKGNPYRDPARTHYELNEYRVCNRCKQEAESGGE